MQPNFVLFDDLKVLDHYSSSFGDENVIVAKDFSEAELREFNQKKRKFATKFFSCQLFEKKDDKLLQRVRKSVDFTAAIGSSPEMNQWSTNQKLDFLVQPFSNSKNFFDLQTANTLKGGNVAVVFLFANFLDSKGFAFSQLIKNATLCAKLCEKAGTKMLFCSGAEKEFELRASKDLVYFAALFGIRKEKLQKQFVFPKGAGSR